MQDEPHRHAQRRRASPSAAPSDNTYVVLLTSQARGFELAEHRLSKQLLVVFAGVPDLDFAARLEGMGFDRTSDEKMFTLEATPGNRRKAIALARQHGGEQQEGASR